MGKEEQLEDKIRPYRLVLNNMHVTEGDVKNSIAKELGEDIEVVNWKIERYIIPRGETTIIVRYKEK